LFSDHINVSVRALLHVAWTSIERDKQSFAAFRLRRLTESDAHELTRGEGANEKVVLPSGELVARIKHDARRTDRRHPVNPRVIHSGPGPRLIGNESPRVVASGRNQRPTIVVTWQANVHV